MNAKDIPKAHTPPGGWRGEMPPPILAPCTEPLVEGAPDLRGTWRAISVEQNGQPMSDHPLNHHLERIEQCGNRVVVTAAGVIHDMFVDGTVENGVNDVSGPPNFGAEIHVAALFTDGRLDLHPMGVREGIPALVTREIVDGFLVWHYGPFKVTLERVDPALAERRIMTDTDMFVASLRNRIRAMNILWDRALSDLTLEQINHHERDGVLPICFSFSHYIQAQDQSLSVVFGKHPPIWATGGWAAKVGVAIDALGREETVEHMQNQRFSDLGAWKAYQDQVIAQTNHTLDTITADALAEVVMPQLPPHMQNIFCGIVVGPGNPIRKLEVLECFVYQHGLRHMGEVEHGRALVGLGGMTS